MHIYGPAHLHGPQSIGPPHSLKTSQTSARTDPTSIQDELEISDAARLVEKAQQAPEIRHDRVAAIRAELAAGTYETQEKLDIAVEKLLDEIA